MRVETVTLIVDAQLPERILSQRFAPLPMDHVWHWLAKGELLAPVPVERRLLLLVWWRSGSGLTPGYHCESCKTTFIGYTMDELSHHMCER